MKFPQKIKGSSATGPSNSTAEYLLKENKTLIWKKYVHPYMICTIIHYQQDIETAQEIKIEREMHKDFTHIHTYIYIYT